MYVCIMLNLCTILKPPWQGRAGPLHSLPYTRHLTKTKAVSARNVNNKPQLSIQPLTPTSGTGFRATLIKEVL